jgi:hypothetical protein
MRKDGVEVNPKKTIFFLKDKGENEKKVYKKEKE